MNRMIVIRAMVATGIGWRQGLCLAVVGCRTVILVPFESAYVVRCRYSVWPRGDCLVITVCGIVVDAFVLFECLVDFVEDVFTYRDRSLPGFVCLVDLLAVVGTGLKLNAVLLSFSGELFRKIVDLSFDLLDLNLGVRDLRLNDAEGMALVLRLGHLSG